MHLLGSTIKLFNQLHNVKVMYTAFASGIIILS